MSKLGYTWYPKDWKTNGKVFNLTLELRGFYREFIDFAYENDNNFAINSKYWCRMLGINKRKFDTLFARLLSKGLIVEKEETYIIPSVEPRIQLIRGGKKSKPTLKPMPKPTPEQREREIETKRESKKKKKFIPPTEKEFMIYAKTCFSSPEQYQQYRQMLLNKFKAWEVSGWVNGRTNKPIGNWKSTLVNTVNAFLRK